MANLSDTLESVATEGGEEGTDDRNGSRPAYEQLFEQDGLAYKLVLVVAVLATGMAATDANRSPTPSGVVA
jgi:hypothetical protein